MLLGFLTACLPKRSLEHIAAWASANGYQALEVAAWPALGDRPFTATHVDVARLDAGAVLATFERHGLTLSSLAYYDNNLHPDPDERRAVHDHVLACIDAAARWGARRWARSSAAIRPAPCARTSPTPRSRSSPSSTGPASGASRSSSRTA